MAAACIFACMLFEPGWPNSSWLATRPSKLSSSSRIHQPAPLARLLLAHTPQHLPPALLPPAGDLGWRTPYGVPGSRTGGQVVITGRQKDTLVLLNGENVEPQPLEDLICTSPHIQFAGWRVGGRSRTSSFITGGGHRALGALLNPPALP